MISNYTWYNRKLNLGSPDTIHQILAYGTLEDLRKLQAALGQDKLRNIFIHYPKKVYTPADFNFLKNFVLNIKDILDEQQYLQTAPRSIRPKSPKTA